MPKEDAELVLPVLEAFTGQWVGYLNEPYDYYFPTEKAVTGGKGSLEETVEAMRKLRKEDIENRKALRKSIYYSMYPESEGLVPVSVGKGAETEKGFQ
jgi:hypothetical protein